jgi:ADP-ribose pyrophosphatase YjhB (NUDIX family)
VKKIQLTNDDYKGYVEHVRHNGRGIVVKDGKVLLSYEAGNDRYITPGGGLEEGETLEDCCVRELLEETGIKVKPIEEYMEIEEFFDTWQHFSHFFICEFIEDTGERHLTEAEEKAAYKNVWIPFDEALKMFEDYERFHSWNLPDYGLYRREYHALKEYAEKF